MPSRAWTCTAVIAVVLGLGSRVEHGQSPELVTRVMPRPRLMFTPGEYRQLVDEIGGPRKTAFDRMTGEIDSRGAKAWNERDLQLESQALAARVLLDRGDSRGERYLGFARQSLDTLLGKHTYTNWRDSHDIVTEGARWLEAVSLAHDWLHDRWTADERERMAAWLDDEVADWVDRNRLARASASPFRNDAARGTSALVMAGLTLFDEPGHEATGRRALAHAQPYYQAILAAHTYAGAGGGMAEGTFYGNFTAWAQTLVAESLFTGAGLTDAYTRSPFYEARLKYAIHAAWPGYLTNQFNHNVHQLAPVFGDARRGPTGSALYNRATMLLLGKRFSGSPAARAAYWVVNRAETARTYIAEWSLYDVLCPSTQVSPERPTALSYREPTLGQVFARTDWTDDAAWMSFNAGPHLDTHQHYDAGNLTIFRRVDLLVDSGSFDRFGSSHWYNYYARTIAHNTITVTDPAERWKGIWGGVPDARVANDGGQRTAAPLTPAPTLDEYLANRPAYDQARIVRYGEGDWGVYVRADLTNAYQNPAYQSTRPDGRRNGVKVTYVGREVVYLRGGNGARDTFVVFDRVTAADPSFKKAVLWHARERFERGIGTVPNSGTVPRATTIDEGETRYEGAERYDFSTDVTFDEGPQKNAGRLFVTVLPVDPVIVREIGVRPPTDRADHATFGVEHHHRHVKDYLVEDPGGIVNTDASLGAAGRPEWPPFNPPEQQWLWTDDLVGGWGRTRLQVEPDRPRASDRFLTVLVVGDRGEARAPAISPGHPVDGGIAATVIQDASRTAVVIFGTDAAGGNLARGAVDVPLRSERGDLIVASLEAGARYSIRMGGGGSVRRIAVSKAPEGGAVADESGMIRIRLDSVPHVRFGDSTLGRQGSEVVAATSGVVDGQPSSTAPQASSPGGEAGTARHPGLKTIAATIDSADLAEWDSTVSRMVRAHQLRLRESSNDTLVPGRTLERYTQMYKGVPVFGGDVTRQVDHGRAVAVFGAIYQGIRLDTTPKLSAADAEAAFEALAGASLGPSRAPELMVLPTDDGAYRLTYRARLATRDDVVMTFIDASTGEPVLTFSDLKRPVL